MTTDPERWSLRLARAGWRAIVVGAAAGSIAFAVSGWPQAQGAALAFAGITAALDLAERTARRGALDRPPSKRLALLVWLAAACLYVASAAQVAFATARAAGAPLDQAWDEATGTSRRLVTAGLGEPLGAALLTSWVPGVLLARLGTVPAGVALSAPIAGLLAFAAGWADGEVDGPLAVGTTALVSCVYALFVLAAGEAAFVVLRALDAVEVRVTRSSTGAS